MVTRALGSTHTALKPYQSRKEMPNLWGKTKTGRLRRQ
jgi:hypothetical protein